MAAVIVTLQFHYIAKYVQNPKLRYANAVSHSRVEHTDIDELHIIWLQDLAKELGYNCIEKFECRVNKSGSYHAISSDIDLLNLATILKTGDIVDVYMFNGNETAEVTNVFLSSTAQSNTQPIVQSWPLNVGPTSLNIKDANDKKWKGKVAAETDLPSEGVGVDEGEGEGKESGKTYYDFSTYHLQTSDESETYYDFSDFEDLSDESLYGSEEDGEDGSDLEDVLVEARKIKIQDKKNKKKPEKVKLDEIPDGPVGIDAGFEDMYKNKKGKYDGKLGGDEQYLDSSDPGSEDSEEEMELVGDDEVRAAPTRRESTKVYYDPNCKKTLFQLEMIFENAIQFRQALQNYSIERCVQLQLRPNERHRVRANCMKEGCPWHILGSIQGSTGNFIVKTYYPAHKCYKRRRTKSCNAEWIAKNLKDRIVGEPQIKLSQMQIEIRKKYELYVNKTACRRGKALVLKQHMGDYKEEFARLYDYADMIRTTNPGSTVVIKTSKETEPGQEVFMGIYVCLDALKKGWLEGCRNIIGFDGAFLKGVCQGEILSCISKDGNNQMYPVAWAVVDKETKNTWSWFMRCLMHDLELTENEGEGLTIMSDMQKGLISAVAELLPNAEHRMCARHVWSNWKQTWRGEERRRKFWQCSRATFEVLLSDKLGELDKLGDKIVEGLLKYKKESFCRAYFRVDSRCDVVENNMCETFNSWILVPRHKSIITMLEDIRHKMMDRMNKLREFSGKWISDVSPMAMEILKQNAQHSMDCHVVWNGDKGYEVLDGKYQHTVDMKKLVCSCRAWQLKGIPCAHAICAMYHKNLEPESFIMHWYRKETYLKAFSHFIQPMTNMKMWPPTTNPTILPPIVTKMPGRPKKKRRKAADEPKKKFGSMSRKGRKMSCSLCKSFGHNKKGCPSKKTPASTSDAVAATSGAHVSAAPSAGRSNKKTPASTSDAAAATSGAHVSAAPSAKKTPASTMDATANSSAAPESAGGSVTTVRRSGKASKRSGIASKRSGTASKMSTESSQQSVQEVQSAAGGGAKRKGNGSTRGGANGGYKVPRAAGYGVLFSNTGAVIERHGDTDRVLSTPTTIKSSEPTSIDIGFKPPGLQVRGRPAISQRQLQAMAQRRRRQNCAEKWFNCSGNPGTQGSQV